MKCCNFWGAIVIGTFIECTSREKHNGNFIDSEYRVVSAVSRDWHQELVASTTTTDDDDVKEGHDTAQTPRESHDGREVPYRGRVARKSPRPVD